MQSMLGRVSVEPGRQIYPLSATLPARFARTASRWSARPPMSSRRSARRASTSASGTSRISLRSSRENRDDPGSPAALSAYDRRRRPDILARAGAVNLLNMSLLSDMLPAQLARSAGLGVLGGFAPLRAFFMREGLQPGSGFACDAVVTTGTDPAVASRS